MARKGETMARRKQLSYHMNSFGYAFCFRHAPRSLKPTSRAAASTSFLIPEPDGIPPTRAMFVPASPVFGDERSASGLGTEPVPVMAGIARTIVFADCCHRRSANGPPTAFFPLRIRDDPFSVSASGGGSARHIKFLAEQQAHRTTRIRTSSRRYNDGLAARTGEER
jgi:hypothetical protein